MAGSRLMGLLLGLVTIFASASVNATVIFRFNGSPVSGLTAVSAEIALSDAALTRTGDIPLADLEFAEFTFTALSEEGEVFEPDSFGVGARAGTAIVPVDTPFEERTGYTNWRGVRIADNTLIFSEFVFIAIAEVCEEVAPGVVLCFGDGAARFLPDDAGADSGLVNLALEYFDSECSEFSPRFCAASGRFTLVQVPEPPGLALIGAGLLALGFVCRRKFPG